METPRWITFDAYGTLVDFNLRPVIVDALGDRLDGIDTFLFLNACSIDRYLEVRGAYKPYRDILRASLRRTMSKFGIEYQDQDGEALIAAIPTFGPFPDVPPVLDALRKHCKIAIISNTEDDLIAANVERIGVPFDRVISAEQAGGYKPSLDVFQYALKELGCDSDEVLHVAQGFEYDIIPTYELGWKHVWINRSGRPGDLSYGPYHEMSDLTGLPALLNM